MDIEVFELERRQSLWENDVEFNLTESGVHPYTLRELFDSDQLEELLGLRLGYGYTNGTPELRRAVAALYPGAGESEVLVTNGSAEANFVTSWVNLEPGDEIVYMVPNYFQIRGLARAFQVTVKPLMLREALGWQPDPDELRSLVSPRTKMIALCNPSNPTGAQLSSESLEEILRLARDAGCWIHVDEVYRGAELDGEDTETLWGRYDKLVISAGLSKAYALPGLRVGWVVGPRAFIDKAWARTDYTTIAPGALSDRAATFVLADGLRARIFERNRALLNDNLAHLQDWMRGQGNRLSLVAPRAGGMAFVRYDHAINSTGLTERLREEKSVLVVAGDCYGMDGYLRIGIGAEPGYFRRGLARLAELLSGLS